MNLVCTPSGHGCTFHWRIGRELSRSGRAKVPGNTNPQVQDFGLATTEGTNNGCVGWRAMAVVVDLNYPSEPETIANMSVPALQGNGEFDFCANDARFGSHSISEDLYLPFHNRFNAIAWFSGGVHIWDLRNPFQPVDVAWFVPNKNKNTQQNCAVRNGVTACDIVAGTNNAATDDRGYVYIVDRYGTGTHILQLTGSAKTALFDYPQEAPPRRFLIEIGQRSKLRNKGASLGDVGKKQRRQRDAKPKVGRSCLGAHIVWDGRG